MYRHLYFPMGRDPNWVTLINIFERVLSTPLDSDAWRDLRAVLEIIIIL